MKQLVFMAVFTLVGTAGALLLDPFLSVLVYYLFAVLRPQYLWKWILPPEVRWSYFVALVAILVALIQVPVGRASARVRGSGEPVAAPGFRGPHLWILAFAGWIGISWYNAHDPVYSEAYVLEYGKIFLMFAVATKLIRSIRQLWILLVMAASCLCYIAYEVNVLYLTQARLDIYHEGYGGLDNNGAALMLATGIPLCFAAWESITKPWRWVFAAFVPVLVHAVLMTYSRGSMLALLVAAPLVWWRSPRRFHLGVGLVLLALVIPSLAGTEIRERFFSIDQSDTDRSAQSRRSSWNAGYAIAKDHPIVGVGPRNADLFSVEYGADVEGRAIHSQYLQIAADSGFVGLGLYVAGILAVWGSVRRTMAACRGREDVEGRRAYAVARGVEGGLLVFLVGASFLSLEVVELPYLLLLLGAQLSSLPVPDRVEPCASSTPSTRPRSAAGTAAS